MRRNRVIVPLLSGAVVLAVAGPAHAQNASTSSIRLSGGQNTSGPMCGTTVNFLKVGLGANAQAVVRGAKTKKGRRARKGTKIVVERCAKGAWTAVSTTGLGARKKAKRVALGTSKAQTGDYRVRIVTRRNAPKGRAAHVRVGVGELVDVPISFTVANTNRTGIPCAPPAPDGGQYTVRGTLVAPRAVLDGKGSSGYGPDVALHYHGLGYNSFFWRFQGEPGYDYAKEQAYDNHASVVVDRLGYGSSVGPANGGRICYSGHSDIADQIVKQLRAGAYTLEGGQTRKFSRVALVGHSAGSLIMIATQGAFQSADAMAITSYHDVAPTPLAFATLTASSVQCGSGGVPGPNGATNYGRFGNSDQDFAAAHFHNVDPQVAAKVLQMRVPDPCGDFYSAVGSFLSSQGFNRGISVPVFFITGRNDALFPGDLLGAQATPFFTPFNLGRTRTHVLPDTGHALTLGRTHEEFRRKMSEWLSSEGF